MYFSIVLLQEELNDVALLWNSHRIRPVKNSVSPSGKPVMLYNFPELFGAQKQHCMVPETSVRICEEECTPKKQFPCDETVFELCVFLMAENDKDMPNDVDEAVALYKFFRNCILREL